MYQLIHFMYKLVCIHMYPLDILLLLFYRLISYYYCNFHQFATHIPILISMIPIEFLTTCPHSKHIFVHIPINLQHIL